jgi:hypothetical protein
MYIDIIFYLYRKAYLHIRKEKIKKNEKEGTGRHTHNPLTGNAFLETGHTEHFPQDRPYGLPITYHRRTGEKKREQTETEKRNVCSPSMIVGVYISFSGVLTCREVRESIYNICVHPFFCCIDVRLSLT